MEVDIMNSSNTCLLHYNFCYFFQNHPVGYSERESKKKVYKLRKIYPEGEVEAEIQNLRESTEMEITEVEAGEGWVSLGKMLKITCEERFICWDGHSLFPTVCGYQHSHVLQPHTIVQLAGFASNQLPTVINGIARLALKVLKNVASVLPQIS
ncbi:hypothetical protein GLYMA_05G142350v4 [Glycine max]|nr:hypothetical protein GLYMA_05G142350v4 [Glycine max]KAH1134338.1 hypothetical protein GYH30_012636 [Glycine max]